MQFYTLGYSLSGSSIANHLARQSTASFRTVRFGSSTNPNSFLSTIFLDGNKISLRMTAGIIRRHLIAD
jgi:hypothetical protein